MNKCVYCGKEIKDNDIKIKSLFNDGKYVCSDCAWREDSMWFNEKNINKFPDFSKELNMELVKN